MPRGGPRYISQTLRAIEEMEATPQQKEQILWGNAIRLLRLDAVGRR